MTLVALFAMTTGAWAQATFGVKEITPDMVPADWNNDDTEVTAEDLAKWGFKEVTEAEALTWTGAPKQGTVKLIYTISSGCRSVDWKDGNQIGSSGKTHNNIYNLVCNPQYNSSNDIYITTEPPLEVTWNAATKTGTFDMPGSDVVLTPIYAPVAQWATESDVELLPTAAEGVIAGTDAPLIVEGTVAPGQGTVMYAVTSTNQATAPELSAFSATVPTAENIADEGADVLVWYYIQGADAPDGQEATEENTFNDSEICATPLEVSVLSNQFDITLNAANANTIEGQNGKGTVTVKTGDAEAVDKTADIDENHQLKAVKMGSEVKMTAKQGYKFRKVEVKKGAAEKTIKIDGQDYTVLNGETWKQFITRNQLSGWNVGLMTQSTWVVYINEPYSKLHVSSDGTNWTLLEFSPQDAPIDTDKQYKWVQEEIGGGGGGGGLF